jgi:hypothetical protein
MSLWKLNYSLGLAVAMHLFADTNNLNLLSVRYFGLHAQENMPGYEATREALPLNLALGASPDVVLENCIRITYWCWLRIQIPWLLCRPTSSLGCLRVGRGVYILTCRPGNSDVITKLKQHRSNV